MGLQKHLVTKQGITSIAQKAGKFGFPALLCYTGRKHYAQKGSKSPGISIKKNSGKYFCEQEKPMQSRITPLNNTERREWTPQVLLDLWLPRDAQRDYSKRAEK